MRKEQFYFDEKRLMVRGRFYELQVNGGGHAPMHKLCSFEECDFRPDGHRRSDREQTNFLLRLYQEKLSNLQEKEELNRIEKLAEESESLINFAASIKTPDIFKISDLRLPGKRATIFFSHKGNFSAFNLVLFKFSENLWARG